MQTKYLAVGAIALALVLGYQAHASVRVDANGAVTVSQGAVLGDSSDDNSGSGSNGGSSGSGSSDDSNDSSGSSESSDDKMTEQEKHEAEKEAEDAKEAAEIEKHAAEDAAAGKSSSHTVTADGTEVETETEAGRTKIEIQNDDTKIKIEQKDGVYKIKTQQRNGTEREFENETEVTVDKSNTADETTITTLLDKALIERIKAQAITRLSLSVDTATNQLSVTTPNGTFAVTILPDEAVQNLLRNNIIDTVTTPASVQEDPTGVDTSKDTVDLEEEDGVPVYKISGVKEQKLFGVFRYKAKIESTVSAETGEVLQTKKSFWNTIFGVLSTNA